MRRGVIGARRVVVVAPHPDDEAIGAWGLMARARGRGARLSVIVVSDGGASHPNSRRWPPARLIPERERETRRAMAPLGLRRGDVRFLRLPDGGLERGAVSRALAPVLRRLRPDLIVGPTACDAHADHCAVAAALSGASPRGVARLGYKVWPASVPARARVAVPLPLACVLAKRRAVRSYRTQTGRITDADAGFTMTWRHIARFVRPVERFVALA